MRGREDLQPSKDQPIGVFDSGLGGLTVAREIRNQLPQEHVIYYGDLARLPYGIKSKQQIIRFSCENTEFLLEHRVKALVVACNSSASASISVLKKRYPVTVVDVIEPAARRAVRFSFTKRIGIIGTQATIESGAYEKILKKLDPHIQIFPQACPLLVPLVEEGWINGKITSAVIRTYLNDFVRKKIDTLILGCTHYPLLHEAIQACLGPKVVLVDSAAPTVYHLQQRLSRLGLLSDRLERGKLQIFVSDLPRKFIATGERFLGCRLDHVKVVPIKPLVPVF